MTNAETQIRSKVISVHCMKSPSPEQCEKGETFLSLSARDALLKTERGARRWLKYYINSFDHSLAAPPGDYRAFAAALTTSGLKMVLGPNQRPRGHRFQ